MITITRDKIYRSTFSLKETKPDSESVVEIEAGDIVFSMGEEIELGEDVTFQRLFDIIILHKDFFNVLYSTEMNGLLIDDFIFDYEKESTVQFPNQEYHLMVSWTSSVYEVDQRLEYYDAPIFEAFGKLNNKIDLESYHISVALSSLSDFKDRLIVLNNEFEIEDENTKNKEMEVVFKASHRPFFLNDVFSSILREVAQYGTPDERDMAKKEMEIRSQEITRWIEEGAESYVNEESLREELRDMINEEYNEEDNVTFWDVLYPKEKPTGKSSKEVMDDAIIALSEGSNLSLEEQMLEAQEAEDYEKAAKIKKLIELRDKKKT